MQIKNSGTQTVLNKQSEVLHLNQRQLSWIIASLLLMFFFIFILGYYCGKKSINQEIANPIEGARPAGFNTLEIKGHALQSEEKLLATRTDMQESFSIDNDSKLVKEGLGPQIKNGSKIQVDQLNDTRYYAQLAGFGSLKFAKKCEENLKSYGYTVKTIEKTGKTNKGESRTWYQVVTEPEYDRESLLKKIQEIKKIANIKRDVVIIALKERQTGVPPKEMGYAPQENERHIV